MSQSAEYKDSELGRIPKEWEVHIIDQVTLKVLDFRGKTPLKIGMQWGEGNIKALSANNVEMGRINFNKECYLASETLYKRWMNKGNTQKGDVLITMEAPLGNIALIPDNEKYILSQRVILIKTKKELVFNEFLKFYLMSEIFQIYLKSYATGTTATGIKQSKLMKLIILLPPLPEQEKIAEVLDTLDEAINKTEAIIEKLKQIKAGLLHDLLTLGLDENGNLRDSQKYPEQFKDSELGRIPKEWEVVRLGDVFILEYGKALLANDRKGNDYPVYGSNGIVGWHEYYFIEPPCIIIGRKGTVGAVVWSENPCWLIDTTYYVKLVQEENSKKFLYWLLISLNLKNLDSSTGIPGLNRHDVYSCKIPLPPLPEQQKIAEILDTHDQRIQKEEEYLDKLKQKKKGLMEDLLTGRVRVNSLLN